jgi:hypothetical protein
MATPARGLAGYGVVDNGQLRERFASLSTAHLADACIRAQVPVRCAPAALTAAASLTFREHLRSVGGAIEE